MTTEVTSLRKQVDDFGQDLDTVKQAQATPEDRLHQPHPSHRTQPGRPARLTKNGPPRVEDHRRPPAPGAADRGDLGQEEDRHGGDVYPKPPKHHFPTFKGENPLLWVDLCYTYFDMYNVLEHNWVSTATLYFEEHAALWLQAYKRTHRQLRLDAFITAVVEEFGSDEFDGQMSFLLQLKQTGHRDELQTGA